MSVVTKSWGVALLFASVCWAQERRPAFVTVVGADGAPVAGATVTCFAGAPLDAPEASDDVVASTSDARGRAIARLLGNRAYSAFAVVRIDADADAIVSAVPDELVAGASAQLVLRPARPMRVVVHGLEAWASRAPLNVLVGTSARNPYWTQLAGEFAPPLPGISGVQVVDRDGDVLWARTWQHDYVGTADRPLEMTLPPPQPVSVRVSSLDGRPQAGVALWQAIDVTSFGRNPSRRGIRPTLRWHHVGDTGSDGVANLQFALTVRDGRVLDSLRLEARSRDFAISRGGIVAQGGPFSGPSPIAVPADQVLPIALESGQSMTITPPEVCDVLVLGFVPQGAFPLGVDAGPVRVRTDPEGRARLPLPQHADARRLAKVTPAEREPVWSVVEMTADGLRVDHTAREVRVRVRDDADQPAHAHLSLVPVFEKVWQSIELPIALDATADAVVRLGPGAWALWATDGDRLAWRVLPRADAATEVTLVLRPMPTGVLHLVDGGGEACSGCAIQASGGYSWNGDVTAPENMFLIERHLMLAPVTEPRTADADGNVRVPMLPLPGGNWRLHFHVPGTQRVYDATLRSGEVVEVVLRPESLPPPR